MPIGGRRNGCGSTARTTGSATTSRLRPAFCSRRSLDAESRPSGRNGRDLSAPARSVAGLSRPSAEPAEADAGRAAARPIRASTASERAVDRRNPPRRSEEFSKAHGADRPDTSHRSRRWAEVVPAIVGLLLFFAALEVLRVELRRVSWVELMTDVVRVPRPELALALALTVLNYLVLTGYDLIAFVYIGKRMARERVMLTSFLAYAISTNVSFAMLSGASVRYRFYSRWGVTAVSSPDLYFPTPTFWLGLLAWVAIDVKPLPYPPLARRPARAGAGGVMLIPPATRGNACEDNRCEYVGSH